MHTKKYQVIFDFDVVTDLPIEGTQENAKMLLGMLLVFISQDPEPENCIRWREIESTVQVPNPTSH